ncbi:MAG: glycosyltransferase [Ignavibacteriae bacterium]|nr:glycosyltransferase [Ignavibacteriota bacterium]
MHHVDGLILLPSKTQRSIVHRLYYKAAGRVFSKRTGLKASNYVLGEVEFSPARIAAVLDPTAFDVVLFEYWHAHRASRVFTDNHVPTVLDMHDVLWQSLRRQLSAAGARDIESRVQRYKMREEAAWRDFTALIAINAGEAEYTRPRVDGTPVFLAQMGTDLSLWPKTYNPAVPHRIGFWGSLSSDVNRRSASQVARRIMPLIWQRYPDCECWIVGANPPDELSALTVDPRIHVTGFVEHPAELLGTMRAVLCPWEGTYGFRSRLVEVMACGVPVVASPDAVYGMGLRQDHGLLLGDTDDDLAHGALRLMDDDSFAEEQSLRARAQVEDGYSFESTYGGLARDLLTLLQRSDTPA